MLPCRQVRTWRPSRRVMTDSIVEDIAVDRRPLCFRNGRMRTTRNPHAGQSFKTLLRRLSKAGFERDFVQRAVLPDWWDERCADDPRLVQDIEIRVARFLGLSISAVSDSRYAVWSRRDIRAHSSGAFVTPTATGWLPRCTAPSGARRPSCAICAIRCLLRRLRRAMASRGATDSWAGVRPRRWKPLQNASGSSVSPSCRSMCSRLPASRAWPASSKTGP